MKNGMTYLPFSPRLWDTSGSEMSDKKVRNPFDLKSSFSKLIKILLGLRIKPLTSRVKEPYLPSKWCLGILSHEPSIESIERTAILTCYEKLGCSYLHFFNQIGLTSVEDI